MAHRQLIERAPAHEHSVQAGLDECEIVLHVPTIPA